MRLLRVRTQLGNAKPPGLELYSEQCVQMQNSDSTMYVRRISQKCWESVTQEIRRSLACKVGNSFLK